MMPDGQLYLSDSGNRRVLQLRANMDQRTVSVVQVFGASGEGPGEMINPAGVAVDGNGNVFVTDSQLSRITKYAADGTYLASILHSHASNVLVTSRGDVLAWPGSGGSLLTRYSNDLTEPEPMLEKTSPEHRSWTDCLFALDRRDNLYWLDNVEMTVRVFDRELNEIDAWDIDPPGLRDDVAERLAEDLEQHPNAFIRPILRMTLNANGDRLMLTYKMARLDSRVAYLYSLDGQLLDQFRLEGIVAGATMDPRGVLVSLDGEALSFSESRWAPVSNSP
jgi:hypothetical protein